MTRRVWVRAPSNIAVIKYMGKLEEKLEGGANLPANPSLSLTLSELATFTEVKWVPGGPFSLQWHGASEIAGEAGLRPMDLPAHVPAEKDKMVRHITRVLQALQADGGAWQVRSANRFPAGAGIASSASGFAALTLGVAAAVGFQARTPADRAFLAGLSRQGSGSSCRSFDGPWVAWSGDQVQALPAPKQRLADLVLVVDETKKQVGSSQAHARVRSSPLWPGRVERATERFFKLRQIIASDALGSRYSEFAGLCFEEAMDMHELFHTAQPVFSYWTERTREVLDWLKQQPGLNVAITLDAGPNIHLLVPIEEVGSVRRSVERRFASAHLKILQDEQGTGAPVLDAFQVIE